VGGEDKKKMDKQDEQFHVERVARKGGGCCVVGMVSAATAALCAGQEDGQLLLRLS